MMSKISKIAMILLTGFVAIVIAGFVIERLFLSSIVIERGESYGFEIGQSREESFEIARSLIAKGDAEEIHVWPDGETHRTFRENENPLADKSRSWKIIVDSAWWNNSVVLTFRDDHVIQIRRTRVIWEMP